MEFDRILLELLNRVSLLEEEVAILKTSNAAREGKISKADIAKEEYIGDVRNGVSAVINRGRDTSKYIFDGKLYGKNRLVLAVVKKYVSANPEVSAEKLMSVFDKSIQGSLGVIRYASEVKNTYSDYARRFFCDSSEVIRTSTDDCVVCTQWGKFNIDNFIARAKQLGMDITTIE